MLRFHSFTAEERPFPELSNPSRELGREPAENKTVRLVSPWTSIHDQKLVSWLRTPVVWFLFFFFNSILSFPASYFSSFAVTSGPESRGEELTVSSPRKVHQKSSNSTDLRRRKNLRNESACPLTDKY